MQPLRDRAAQIVIYILAISCIILGFYIDGWSDSVLQPPISKALVAIGVALAVVGRGFIMRKGDAKSENIAYSNNNREMIFLKRISITIVYFIVADAISASIILMIKSQISNFVKPLLSLLFLLFTLLAALFLIFQIKIKNCRQE